MIVGARTALVALLLFVALSGLVNAQVEYNVVDIEIHGNRIATESLIMGVSSIVKGSPLTPAVIQKTIHRLYGLGLFSDVRLDAEEAPGGLKVFITVKELPKLAGLEFEGNKKIKSKDLKESLGLGVGGYISPYLIHLKRQEIADKYAKKGYFQAKVEGILDYNSDSTEAILTFKIEEKSKIKVEKVEVTGNDRVHKKTLIKEMRNRKRGFLKSSDFAQEKYEEDLEKVIEEYHKRGYLDAFMISDSTSIDTASNKMTVHLNVYEGPRYYFGTVEFNQNEIISDKYLASKMKFKEGKVFDTEKYEESVFEIYTAYQEIGHLHCRVFDERTTRADSVIDISYNITEGLPAHINLVKITGNTRTKDHVIRREFAVRPGQIFNRSLLMRSVRDAMALNFFSNVEPVPIDLPNGDIDLEFKVTEKQTGQVSAGAGYNSQDKLVGSLGMGIPNFRGNGQSLSFNIEFGKNRSSFSVSFTEPWLCGRPTLFGADIFSLNRRWYDDYTEGRQGASIRLGRRLRWPDNYFRIVGSYRVERNRFHDYDDDFLEQNSRTTLVNYDWVELRDGALHNEHVDSTRIEEALPGSVVAYEEEWKSASRIALTLTRDSRNLPEFSTSGSLFSYSFENTGGPLTGYWRYQRHRISFAKFVPLFWKVALAAKVQYGVIIGGSDDDLDKRILISDRFNPGGTAYDGTVRGYDDGTLTPDSVVTGSRTTVWYNDDPENIEPGDEPDSTYTTSSFTTRVRGKYMLVSNIELQIPIVERSVYGLVFFDAGNSWLHANDIKPFTDMYKGVGVGFRVLVPGIGTIGFDFAKPLDDPPDENDDRSWRPHFQIGTTIR